jgi:hypothetical protein
MVWQMVALDKQAHPSAPRQKRSPNPDERPQQATAPHQAWFIDVRYLAKIERHWLSSILLFDGYSRAIVGAGCFDRQNLSRVVQVCRQAIAQWDGSMLSLFPSFPRKRLPPASVENAER